MQIEGCNYSVWRTLLQTSRQLYEVTSSPRRVFEVLPCSVMKPKSRKLVTKDSQSGLAGCPRPAFRGSRRLPRLPRLPLTAKKTTQRSPLPTPEAIPFEPTSLCAPSRPPATSCVQPRAQPPPFSEPCWSSKHFLTSNLQAPLHLPIAPLTTHHYFEGTFPSTHPCLIFAQSS